ncbi:MAG: hypothetical protein U5L96_01185 [Owenweeksia sp.]|nr:hypothetical protein [Owenweeksia sp.]
MKKFSLLFCLIFISFGLLGSHMAGGEIWYEYTGDANNPYKYRVWLQFYRDVTGIAAPMNEEISVKSSCFPDQCVNLIYAPFTLEPGSDTAYGSVAGSILTPDLEECVDVNSGGTFVQTEVYRFYADVTLDGTCHDWTFGFNENARNPNSNLTGAGTFYIEAQLNNTLGPNSGPVFVNPAAKSFCVGSPFVWSQAAVEPDGDSLYFDFGSPLTSADACPTNPNPMQFAAGYSKTQPMVTSSGISINHGKGTFRFTPSQPEVDVINVTVTEYRWDSLSGQYLVNGTSVRDLQVPIMEPMQGFSRSWSTT